MTHDQMIHKNIKGILAHFFVLLVSLHYIMQINIFNHIVLQYLFKALLKKQKDIIWQVPINYNDKDKLIELHTILVREN